MNKDCLTNFENSPSFSFPFQSAFNAVTFHNLGIEKKMKATAKKDDYGAEELKDSCQGNWRMNTKTTDVSDLRPKVHLNPATVAAGTSLP